MDNIKDSFKRVKEDINSLNKELEFLNKEVVKIRHQMNDICEILKNFHNKIEKIGSTQKTQNQLNIQTLSTHNQSFKPLNTQNLDISIGNEGVPTDRQTNQQTDRHTQNIPKNPKNSVDNALEILESLDAIKREIRLKFKKLTDQEWLIFSTLYQLEEEKGPIEYKALSDRLNLTESSIRDYIGRLINKDIPILKEKINNKTIQLSISQNLKKIATLPTIMQLRDL